MPIIVEVPDVGTVEFPDDFTEDKITDVLSKEFAAPKPAPVRTEPVNPVQQGLAGVARAANLADFTRNATNVGLIAPQLPDLGSELRPESARNIGTSAVTQGGPQLRATGPEAAARLGAEISEGAKWSPIPTPFKIEKDENPFVAAGKEVVNLGVSIPQFFTSGLGMTTAGAGALAPGVVATLFTGDLLKTLGKQVHDTYENWDKMTAAEKTVAVVDMIGTGFLSRLTGKHAIKAGTKFAESYTPKGAGVEPPPPEPMTQKQILDVAAKQMAQNVRQGELIGGEGERQLTMAGPPTTSPYLVQLPPSEAAPPAAKGEEGKVLLSPIRENGGRTSIVLKDGTAIVGGRFHSETANEAIRLGVATDEQLSSGIAAFTRPDGTSWDLKGNPIEVKSIRNLQEESKPAPVGSVPVEQVAPTETGTRTPTVIPSKETVKPSPNAPQGEPGVPLFVSGELRAEKGGGLIGMGGAAPSEFAPAREFTTKTTVEQINKERKERGLGPIEEHEVFGNKQAVAEAKKVIDENPDAPEQILSRLRDKPETALDPTERAIMVIHRADLLNSYYRALKNWREHFEADDFVRATQESELADFYSKKLSETESLVSERGAATAAGRSLQAIKMGITEDYSLDMMTLRAMKAKGEPLTPEEGNQIVKEHEILQAKIKQLEEALAKEREKGTESDIESAVKAARKTAKKAKAKGAQRDLDAEQAEVLSDLKEKFVENDASLAGQETSIRKLMELLVEREGITDRLQMETRVHEILSKEVDPTITREQAMDLMSRYGKSKLPSPEFAKRTVRDIVAQILSVRKLLDYFKGERPKLTGQLRDAPSDIQRGLIKMVNEAKKAFKLEGPTPDNARAIKSAIDAINTRLKNRIADLKQEIATRQKIIRERQPTPYNAETLRMRAEVAELQKAHKEIFGKPELTDAQRLALLEKSTDRQISELERQLQSGEIFPQSRIPFARTSPKLEAAKARLDELKQTREFARESLQPKIEPTERFLLNYLMRLREREAQYRERIAKGDFEKKIKRPREFSPEILQAKAEVELAKQDFHKGVMAFEMARRSKLRKIWDGIKQTKNAFVNIASSYDLSAPRQMFLAMLSNSARLATSPLGLVTKKITGPKEAARLMFIPLGRMFQSLASERRSQQLEQWRKTRPNAASGTDKISEIQYTDLHAMDWTKWEENAHSVLDEWAQLPFKTGKLGKTIVTAPVKVGAKGVRASNRAFITALNTMRAMLQDHLLEVNFKDRAPNEAELKTLGNLVNVSTGRGKLSRGVAKATGELLWSPSLLASRIQVLLGQPLWGGGPIKESGRARWVVAKEYARWIASGTALIGISRIFSDKYDNNPTSSDFGKIVRGKTRIDPWAGFQQPIVLAARLAQGKTTSSTTGKVENISKFGSGEVIWTFFKNKARPDIAAAVRATIAAIDYAKSANRVRVTVGEAVKQTVPVPLAVQDVIHVMKDRGMAEGAIIQVLSEFGVGVNTYEEKEKQK